MNNANNMGILNINAKMIINAEFVQKNMILLVIIVHHIIQKIIVFIY
jgi:hypothetical protein